MRRHLALFLAVLLAGCGALPRPQPCAPQAGAGAGVWLLDRGWHTEVALPVGGLDARLAALAGEPRAGFVAFGFGKRDFVLAGGGGLGVWLAGPIPGPAVVEVTRREWLPGQAIWLPLTGPGLAALGDFLAGSVAPGGAGPVRVAGEQRFFNASRGYSLGFTCNTWVAQALAVAGLPVSADGVRLTRGVLGQVAGLPRACVA